MSLHCHAPCIHNHFVSVFCMPFSPFILIFRCIWLLVTGFFFFLSLHAVCIKLWMCSIVLFVALKHMQFMNLNDDAHRRVFHLYVRTTIEYWIENVRTHQYKVTCLYIVRVDTNDYYFNCVINCDESVTFWIWLEPDAFHFSLYAFGSLSFWAYVIIICNETKTNNELVRYQ